MATWLYSIDVLTDINEDDMNKLWMGLYMSMWMADKPLVQVKINTWTLM